MEFPVADDENNVGQENRRWFPTRESKRSCFNFIHSTSRTLGERGYRSTDPECRQTCSSFRSPRRRAESCVEHRILLPEQKPGQVLLIVQKLRGRRNSCVTTSLPSELSARQFLLLLILRHWINEASTQELLRSQDPNRSSRRLSLGTWRLPWRKHQRPVASDIACSHHAHGFRPFSWKKTDSFRLRDLTNPPLTRLIPKCPGKGSGNISAHPCPLPAFDAVRREREALDPTLCEVLIDSLEL